MLSLSSYSWQFDQHIRHTPLTNSVRHIFSPTRSDLCDGTTEGQHGLGLNVFKQTTTFEPSRYSNHWSHQFFNFIWPSETFAATFWIIHGVRRISRLVRCIVCLPRLVGVPILDSIFRLENSSSYINKDPKPPLFRSEKDILKTGYKKMGHLTSWKKTQLLAKKHEQSGRKPQNPSRLPQKTAARRSASRPFFNSLSFISCIRFCYLETGQKVGLCSYHFKTLNISKNDLSKPPTKIRKKKRQKPQNCCFWYNCYIQKHQLPNRPEVKV